jgi:O-succinylbenzoic acid--CoA ligase
MTNEFFELKEGKKALLALPMQYIAAKMMIARAIAGGFNLFLLQPSSNPLSEWNEPVDFVPLTPHQLHSTIKNNPEKISLINTLLLGGSHLNEILRKWLSENGINAFASFGMAETLSHFALGRITFPEPILYRPFPGVHLSQTESGKLSIEWEGILEEPLITNDLVELGASGFRWLGRVDNLINTGGVKVFPEKIEEVLAQKIEIPFFIYGLPDEALGQEVVLFVEGKGPLQDLNFEFLPRFERPRRIIYLDRFHYTSSGKIKRGETVTSWWTMNPSGN